MMNKLNFKKGFTLIELLTVVAIIGILLSIVLALLTTARNKGRDSAIKTQMKSLQNQVELTFVGSYAAAFTNVSPYWASDNTQVQALLTSIDKQTTIHTAYSTAPAWAAQARLVQDPTKYFCVDSATHATISTNPLSGATVCP